MRKIILTSILGIFTFLLNAHAFTSEHEGANHGGGGDEVALDFKLSLNSAILTARTAFPDLFAKMKAAGITSAEDDVRVEVVGSVLRVTDNGVSQESVAENFPAKKLILVNRQRWGAIDNIRVKEAIALHEYASIQAIEGTGEYTLSGKYLNDVGLPLFAISNSISYQAKAALELKRVMQTFREACNICNNLTVDTPLSNVTSLYPVGWLEAIIAAHYATIVHGNTEIISRKFRTLRKPTSCQVTWISSQGQKSFSNIRTARCIAELLAQ